MGEIRWNYEGNTGGGYGGIKWNSEVMGKFGRGGIMVKLREGDLSGIIGGNMGELMGIMGDVKGRS